MLPYITRDIENRNRSNRYLRYSFLTSLIIFFLFFYFFPPFEFKPYELPYQAPIEIVMPDEIEIPPAPREIAQPAFPIEVADEGEVVDDVEVPPNVFNSPSELPAQPPIESEDVAASPAFDEAPVLIEAVNPAYPELAKQAGIEGTVLLRLLIGRDGKVLSVSIIQSNVTPAMEKAAIAAARKFRFEPARKGTHPVRANMAFPVTFRIQ